MRSAIRVSILLLALAPCPTLADRSLIPSLESASEFCPDRPEEPEWIQTIALRDAHQRVLVQDIYRAQSMERVISAGECSCETRFPAWDAAEQAFLDRYAEAERWELIEASDMYSRQANVLRPEAMTICEAEGNW